MRLIQKIKKPNGRREIRVLGKKILSYKRRINNSIVYDAVSYPKYFPFLRELHYLLQPKIYVEIGVSTGSSIILADSNTTVIGIDPVNRISRKLHKNIKMFFETSDDFFQNHNIQKEFGHKIDLAFMDGMHLFEYYLRDFINLEKNANKNAVIVIHDTTPVDYVSSQRERKQDFWTGDVFKLALVLKKYRPDLYLYNSDYTYTGVCCVTNLNPNNNVLQENYQKILDEFMPLNFNDIKNSRDDILFVKHDLTEFLEYLNKRNIEFQ